MKKALCVVVALAMACWFLPSAYSQNLLNRPESIEYDFHSDLYFVSNWGDGNIIQIDNSGQQSIYHSGFTRLAGLHKFGNMLYVAANLEPYIGVYGLRVGDGQIVAEIPIPGSGLVNDITSDTSGNLYATDFYNGKIYKIRMSDYAASIFVDTGLGDPNGIVFDIRHNRLLTACQNDVGRPIKAVSLEDSSVSVLVYTYLSGVDGLAFDNEHRLYFSSWQTNCVYRYDSAYVEPPELVSDAGYSGPADIFINRLQNMLCVPDFYNDRIEFVQLLPSAVDDNIIPSRSFLARNYPNPFNAQTLIQYFLPMQSMVSIDILDILGRKIETIDAGIKPAGKHQVLWNADDLSSGIYFYKIQAGDYGETKKMLLIK